MGRMIDTYIEIDRYGDRKQIDRDRMIDAYEIIDGDRDRYKYKAY